MEATFWAKTWASLVAALWLYWMRTPHAIVILMWMMFLDLSIGSIVAVVLGQFKPRKLGMGILLKAIAFPLLAACDLAEDPLHLTFHLDSYVALALVAYEFLSIIETYSKVRPLPRILVKVTHQIKEWLAVEPDLGTKKVDTLSQLVQVIPTSGPGPDAVLTTFIHEAHTELVNPEEIKKSDDKH